MMFTLIMTIVNRSTGFSTIQSVPGFTSGEACNIAANNWLGGMQAKMGFEMSCSTCVVAL